MAEHQIANATPDAMRTAQIIPHPAAMPNMAAISRIMSQFEREQLEGFIAVAIDLVDTLDGECDLEDTYDTELDESDSEDSDPLEEDNEDRCLAGDDGCAAFAIHGRIHWGVEQDDALHQPKPKYGIDQRLVLPSREYGTPYNVD